MYLKLSLLILATALPAFAEQNFYFVVPDQKNEIIMYPQCVPSEEKGKSHCNEPAFLKIQDNAVIYDCKIVKGECAPEVNETRSSMGQGVALRHVEYYFFNEQGVCSEVDSDYGKFSDTDTSRKTWAYVAKTIFAQGLKEGLPNKKNFERVEKYLSKIKYDKDGDRVYHDKCFQHYRGWVAKDLLTTVPGKDRFLTLEGQGHCVDCLNYKSSEVKKIKELANQVAIDFQLREKQDTLKNAKIIAECEGLLSFPNIKLNLEKKGSRCGVSVVSECSQTTPRLLVTEELVNGIILPALNDNAQHICRDAEKEFRHKCGLAPNMDDSREKKLKRFADVRKLVKEELVRSPGNKLINEGVLMCLFNVETTNYDSSKVNYMGCGPSREKKKALYEQFRKALVDRRPPTQDKNTGYVFQGWVSSAPGLGQMTFQTFCETVRAYPEKYPYYKGLRGMSCSDAEAKKLLESFFIQLGQSEQLQIQITLDALRNMYSRFQSLQDTIRKYDTDDHNGTFEPFVTACKACFDGKKVSDESAFDCVHKKRSILNAPEKNEED